MAKNQFITFYQKVEAMRKAQKDYFSGAGSKKALLVTSKTLETNVDQMLKIMKPKVDAYIKAEQKED